MDARLADLRAAKGSSTQEVQSARHASREAEMGARASASAASAAAVAKASSEQRRHSCQQQLDSAELSSRAVRTELERTKSIQASCESAADAARVQTNEKTEEVSMGYRELSQALVAFVQQGHPQAPATMPPPPVVPSKECIEAEKQQAEKKKQLTKISSPSTTCGAHSLLLRAPRGRRPR